MSGINPKLEMVLAGGDWPWPVSRKTSEGGIKKSFLFEPSGEFKRF